MNENGNEFYIHSFSNADTEKNHDNRLTSFTNNLPLNLELPYEEKWNVCVKSIGFSSKFPSINIPKDENIPSIIIHSKISNDPECSWIHESNIFFPSRFSDVKSIKKALEVIEEKDLGIEFFLNEDENIKIVYTKKSHVHYQLYVHEEIVKSFGLSKNNKKLLKLKHDNNNTYFEYIISPSSPVIHGHLKRWNFKHPDLVRIECDQVMEQIFNSRLTRDLKIFCPSFETKEKYTIHQFDSEEYIPLSNSVLDKLSFSIRNENDDLIDIDYGVSTFIKLKFKKMNSQPDSFNVRISPSENQECNEFVIDLPQPYYLDSDWKVSLSSISYANIFRPLPHEKDLRLIITSNMEHGSGDNEYTIPNLMYTPSGIIFEINKFLSMGNEHGKFKMEEVEEYGEKKIKVSLDVYSQSIITMSLAICELLGFDHLTDINTIDDEDEHEGIDIRMSRDGNYVVFVNTNPVKEETRNVKFSRYFDINKFRPDYLMIYTDIIEQSIVGNSFSKLVKIVPVYHESTDAYKTQDFKNNEFYSLENTLIKQIKFQIRSHSGNLINFMEGSKIFINLLFSK